MNIMVDEMLMPSLTADELRKAYLDAKRLGCNVTTVVEESYNIEPGLAIAAIARLFHYRVLDMPALNGYSPAFDILPFADVARRECMVLRDGMGNLAIVFCDPFNVENHEWIEVRVGVVTWYLTHPSDFAAYLARFEDGLRAMDSIVSGGANLAGEGGQPETLSLKGISEDPSPVVKLVHSTLYDALKGGASDIHIESHSIGFRIKYRIDGVLTPVSDVPGVEMAEHVISRIKVMSQLDFRVSIMPSNFGEDAVLRILDRQSLSGQMHGLTLDVLGFDADSIAKFRLLSSEPYGMVLVTGPTGSGKTSTLYAAISEINDGENKIITIEDPVEYDLPGVLQIPVNEKKGLTFARGLRSILRHDPDKIMVGEIRDAETAQIAIQSALTGHLVFTTVHANNVFDVIGRFMHMGVDPYSFVSALNGILAQRLVRLTCPHCAESQQPSEDTLRKSGILPEQAKHFRFVAGKGCGQCRGTGYKGRKAIAEMLHLNDEIRELIVAREPVRSIKEAARRNGTRYLREAALDLVRLGETTLKEINRVTFVA